MQKDFHYYCIAVLAKAAGFNTEDALNIAYASQYVDDATESEPIKVEFQSSFIAFDPTRTAHIGLRAGEWSVQKRVYIPFHFLTPKSFDHNKAFSFVTEPDSDFARKLLKKAENEPLENWNLRLCKIGIALHTYADTWSHQRFSGRSSSLENDVESISIFENGKYKKLKIENILYDTAPEIGHAEAGFFPDMSFLKWKFKLGKTDKYIERDNTSEFLTAADKIYNWLVNTEKPYKNEPIILWDIISNDIQTLLESEDDSYKDNKSESRCDKWKEKFEHLFDGRLFYDKKQWRQEAFEGDVDWDGYRQRDWEQMSPYKLKKGFWNSMWEKFHRAALQQRHFVLENLP